MTAGDTDCNQPRLEEIVCCACVHVHVCVRVRAQMHIHERARQQTQPVRRGGNGHTHANKIPVPLLLPITLPSHTLEYAPAQQALGAASRDPPARTQVHVSEGVGLRDLLPR